MTRPQSLLQQTTVSDKKEWYFGFCSNTERLPWYQRMALRGDPENIQHTYAFSQTGQFILFVEPSFTKVELTVKYPDDGSDYLCAYNAAKEIASAGHIIVKHKFSPNIRGTKTAFNFIPSCVSVVKVATGYASLAVTPYQLLGDLIHDGAEIVWAK